MSNKHIDEERAALALVANNGDVDYAKKRQRQTEPPMPPGTDNERIATLEAIIPTLATKIDLHTEASKLRTEMHEGFSGMTRWIVGTALAMSVAGITVMTFVLNNATPKSPPPPPQAAAPVIINIPAPAPQAAPPAKP